MQLTLMNVLLGAPTANGAPASTQDGAGGGGDVFAQLLSEGGAQFEQEKQNTGGMLPTELTANALVAQEIEGALNIRALIDQEISPEDAQALIDQIESMIASAEGDADQQQAWQQFQEALKPVAEGDQAVRLSEVLKKMQMAEAISAVAAPVDTATLTDPHPAALTRMLAWVHTVLEKRKEIALQSDAEEASLALLSTGLQAAMFRADTRADIRADAAASAKEKEPTVIEITPLAQQQAVPPEWLAAIIRGEKNAALDTVIPPLELSDDDALPLVTLPQAGSEDILTDVALPGALLAAEQKSARQEEWLKHLPFPVKISDAAAANAADTSFEMAQADIPVLAPLPSEAKAQDATPFTLPDVTVGDKYANESGRPLILSAVTPTNYARSTHAQPAYIPHPPIVASAPADQVYVAIRNAAGEGIDRITIQLEPADLGRVEVRMNVAHDGRTHMIFTADRAATLDLLAREVHGLERSLADSGIKADAGSMEFNLRQPPQFVNTGAGQDGSSQGQPSADEEDHSTNETIAPLSDLLAPSVAQTLTLNVSAGVDIQA